MEETAEGTAPTGDPAEPSRPEDEAGIDPSLWIQKPAAAKDTRGRRRGATVNKTQEIRALAREAIDDGLRPSPTRIAAELMRRKQIEVSGAQVSMALRGTGMEYRRKPPPEAARPENDVSVADLAAVRDFLRRIGSVEKALKSIAVYRELLADPAEDET